MMEDKYLPIGTICTVKNINKSIMIIGYYSTEYNGNVKMYDYKGIVYPEGSLLLQNYSFNHEDITKIEYLGYKNDQYEKLNNNLNRKVEEENLTTSPVMSNIKFDENGVVIFDGTTSLESDLVKEEPVTTINPFKANYNPEPVNTENKTNIFKFDENGVVIDDGTNTTVVPTFPKYKFDENGFVISEEEEKSINEEKLTSGFKFDENGVVIDDGTNTLEPSIPVETEVNPTAIVGGFKFDENGVVIDDGSNTLEPAPEVLSEANTQASTGTIKFDENGIVISE